MLKRGWFALAVLGLLFSSQAWATKFVAIKVGNVRIVTPIDGKPVASSDTAYVNEVWDYCYANYVHIGSDYCITHIDVLANDTDPEGQPLSIVSVQGAEHAQVLEVDPLTQKIKYVPSKSFYATHAGSDSFVYTIEDTKGHQSTGTVNLTVNRAPVVADLTRTIQARVGVCDASHSAWGDCFYDIRPMSNDPGDPEGDAIEHLISFRSAEHSDTIHWYYAPDIGVDWGPDTLTAALVPWYADPDVITYQATVCMFGGTRPQGCERSGVDNYGYRVMDARGALSRVADVTIRQSSNAAPEAVVDQVMMFQGASELVDVLANDSDADSGQNISLVSVASPEYGVATIDNGTVRYTPDAGFVGVDTFTYIISDSLAETATGTVIVTVVKPNSVPVADDMSVTTDEDVAVDFVLDASDADGHTLTYHILSGPSHGTLERIGGAVTYIPNQHFDLSDSFTYRVSDAESESGVATVTIAVNAINDAPTFSLVNVPPLYVAAGESYSFTPQVSDVETATSQLTFIRHASLPAWLSLDSVTGTVSGIPDNTHAGTYQNVTLVVSDGELQTEKVFDIIVTYVNNPPVAGDVQSATDEDVAVAIPLAGSDEDNDPLTWTIDVGPANGTVTLTGATATYDPDDNYFGPDSFTYTVNDGQYTSVAATVDITVRAINDIPVAAPVAIDVNEDGTVNLTLSGTDVETAAASLTYEITQPTANGTLSGSAPNLTYSPSDDYFGSDSLFYVVKDGESTSAAAEVTITVNAVNDAPQLNAPVGMPVKAMTGYAWEYTFSATDIDQDTLTYSASGTPAWMQTDAATGRLYGTPSATDVGQSVVTVSVSDGSAGDSVGPFVIDVLAHNEAPTIAATPVPATSVKAGEVYSFRPVVADDDSDFLMFTLAGAPDWLHVAQDTGEVYGTPSATDTGVYNGIIFSVDDGFHTTQLAPFSIQVTGATVDTGWLNTDHNTLSALPSDTLPVMAPLTQHLVGELKGQASVDGGAFHYHLPVSLPPGINGHAPSVGLSYSSQGGSGNAGYGWNLSAGSAISRCASIYAIDNTVQNVLLTSDDALCLDGQRLILQSGTHGAVGATYKTERDAGVVVQVADAGFDNSTSQFVVTANNGSTRTYGQAFTPVDAATIDTDTPLPVSTPLSWHLSRSTDIHGNVIDYEYDTSVPGEIVLTDIYYTGSATEKGTRQVHFRWASDDHIEQRVSYGYGYQTRQSRRLSGIEVLISEQKTDEYVLRYTEHHPQTLQRNTLDAVSHVFCTGSENPGSPCEGDAIAIDFRYHKTTVETADTDGDPANNTDYDQFYVSQEATPFTSASHNLRFQPYAGLGDYDGDGFPEKRVFQFSPAENRWLVYFRMSATGNLLRPTHASALEDNAGYQALYQCDPTDDPFCALYGYEILANTFRGEMDADFDGKQDFVYIDNHYEVAFGSYTGQQFDDLHPTGTGIDALCSVDVYASGVGLVGCQSYVIDINQDGRMDLLVANGDNTSQSMTAWLRNNSGNGFTAAGTLSTWLVNYQIMDIDGDGQQELVDTGDKDPANWHWYDISMTGSQVAFDKVPFPTLSVASPGTGENTALDREHYTRPSHSYWLDTNGDGLADLVTLHDKYSADYDTTSAVPADRIPEYLQWYVSLNRGAGLFADFREMTFPDGSPVAELLSSNNGLDNPGGRGSLTPYMKVFDFNGDGRDDFLVPANSVVKYACVLHNANTDAFEQLCDPDETGWDKRHYKRDVWNWKVWQSDETGTGFTEIALDTEIIGALSTTGLSDVNSDGQQDIVTTTGFDGPGWNYEDSTNIAPPAERVYYRNGSEFKRDLLSGVTTTMATALTLDYQPLTRDYGSANAIYGVEHTQSSFPYINFGSSMVVVSAMETDNGIGGMNRQTYTYQNARFHLQGRGFQGFGTITVNNVAAGTTTTTDYYQDFPMTGRIASVDVTDNLTGNRLSSTVNTGPYLTGTGGVYCPYVGTQTQLRYDPVTERVTSQKVMKQGYHHDYCVPEASTTYVFDYRQGITIADPALNAETHALSAPDAIEDNGAWISHTTTTSTDWAAPAAGAAAFIGIRKASESTAVSVSYSDLLPAEQPADRGTVVSYAYTGNHLYPDSVTTTSAGNGALTLTRTMTYDGFGNVKRVTHTGHNIPETARRWQETEYDDKGYFVAFTRNSEWQDGEGQPVNVTTLSDYHARYGLPGTVTDVNGINTTTTYNALGLPTSVTVDKAGATPAPAVYTAYQWTDDADPARARFKVRTVQAGAPQQITFTDSLGRVIETRVQAPENIESGAAVWVAETTTYDAPGRVTQTTTPGGGTTTWAGFDVLGRPGSRQVNMAPQSFTSTYAYAGADTTVTVTGDNTLTMSRTYNSRQQLMATTDALGGSMSYTYDGMGNPTRIQDVLSNVIAAQYNDFGQKTRVDDPNQGGTTFTYNALGELLEQTDANGLTTVLTLDNLGRVTQKTQGADISTWEYDPVVGATTLYGAADSESRSAGGSVYHRRDFTYDSLIRVISQTDDLGSEGSYTQHFQYDNNFGRLLGQQSASGLVTAFSYDARGIKIADYVPGVNGGADKVLATRDTFESTGQVKQQTFGQSVVQHHSWYLASGQLNQVTADGLQSLVYDYDGYGNMTRLTNDIDSVTKIYAYDKLHRLDNATVNTGYTSGTIDYDYNAAGNIILKQDYGSHYQYGDVARTHANAGPNALRQITRNINGVSTVINYEYDLAGNLTDDSLGLKITYDGNHHTQSVTRTSAEGKNAVLTFWYDANGQRVKQQKVYDGVTTTTLYLGNVEKVITADSGNNNNNSTLTRDYVGDHSIITRVEDGQDDSPLLSHLLRDRLGSVSVVLNGDMATPLATERRDYDAFGKPIKLRNPNLPIVLFEVTPRGFTDHEHLAEVELIHMNGRAYDYNTGRFLSVDPFIQSPTNSQSVNPYSYIMNNPLAGIDPTGYTACEPPECETITVTPEDDEGGKNPHKSACKAKGSCDNGPSNGGSGNKHTRNGDAEDEGKTDNTNSQEYDPRADKDASFTDKLSLAWELISEGDIVRKAVEDANSEYLGDLGIAEAIGAEELIQGAVDTTNAVANGDAKGIVDGATKLAVGRFKIAKFRGPSDQELIKASLALLVVDGMIDYDMLTSWVPEGAKNLFGPNDRIPSGQKYALEIGGVPVEIKWHSADSKWRGISGSNSGAGWTAQIAVGKRRKRELLTTEGTWTRKVDNNTHIPIRF